MVVPQVFEEIAVFNHSKSDFCIAAIFGGKRVYFAPLQSMENTFTPTKIFIPHEVPFERTGQAVQADKGLETIQRHAADFIRTRLAPASIPNDGKQTPMRGHPVFIAQHACACCCRGCLHKWYHVPVGRELTENEQERIVKLLMAWIERQLDCDMK